MEMPKRELSEYKDVGYSFVNWNTSRWSTVKTTVCGSACNYWGIWFPMSLPTGYEYRQQRE